MYKKFLIVSLKTIFYSDFSSLVPYLIYFCSSWVFFFKVNFWGSKIKKISTDKLTANNPIKKTQFVTVCNFFLVCSLLFLTSLTLTLGYETSLFFGHLVVSNFNTLLIKSLLILMIVFFMLNLTSFANSLSYSSDYIFSITNIVLYSCLLFLSNSIFSFIFVLELSSITIFYNFVSAKSSFSKSPGSTKPSSLGVSGNPHQYLSMLLFQYWATFFSSILIFFSLILIFLKFNSTEFFLINYVYAISLNSMYEPSYQDVTIWTVFTLGLLIKLSITPFHLFKIEVYKGLPLLGILFYTSVYFLVNFIFFLVLFNIYLVNVKSVLTVFFIAYMILSSLYIISLLFDLSSLKSFLGYSTVVNTTIFILLSVYC